MTMNKYRSVHLPVSSFQCDPSGFLPVVVPEIYFFFRWYSVIDGRSLVPSSITSVYMDLKPTSGYNMTCCFGSRRMSLQ